MRTGLYGGSFDPVHLGHLLVAQAAREEVGLDEVVFIPAAQSPFKPGRQLSAEGLRLRMLRMALAGRTYCKIDDQELRRGGVSYSIETVRNYRAAHPGAEIFYLIGGDHVEQLPKWREAAELARLVEFVVIPRPGEPRKELPAGFRGRHLAGFPLGVSSSQIRARVKQGKPVDLLTGREVAGVVKDNGLYLS